MNKGTKNNTISDRVSAMIKLGIWIIFFIFLITLLTRGYKENYNEPINNASQKNTFRDYNEMVNELLTKDYNYTFKVINDYTYIYTGTKCGSITNGIKTYKDSKINYIIRDNQVYKKTEETEELTDSLYESLDTNILNISLLFDSLKNKTIAKTINNDKQQIKYLIDYKIEVITNLNSIEMINIEKDNIIYELSFNILDKCNVG